MLLRRFADDRRRFCLRCMEWPSVRQLYVVLPGGNAGGVPLERRPRWKQLAALDPLDPRAPCGRQWSADQRG